MISLVIALEAITMLGVIYVIWALCIIMFSRDGL